MDSLRALLDVMRRLRDPEQGCPWDLQQDFHSIAPYTLEEAYEVADAIQREDWAELKDELGDLLFQVVFHSQMAQERGLFDFEQVAAAIVDKLTRRHPHVFGGESEADAASQTQSWEAIKAEERRRKGEGGAVGALAGVSVTLPALMRAHKLSARAARVGFDWDSPEDVLEKVREEVQELQVEVEAGAAKSRLEDELGDCLFALTSLARHLGVDPEAALRGTNAKFERRFGAVEAALTGEGRRLEDADMAAMEAAWQAAKRTERGE